MKRSTGAVRKRANTARTGRVRHGPALDGALAAILWDANPACVQIIAHDGTLSDMNPAGIAMVEADSREQILGTDPATFIHKNDRKPYTRSVARALSGRSSTCEFTIIGLKGGTRQLRSNMAPSRDAKGRVVACLAISVDVTELKRTEKRARDSEARYRDLVEGSSDWIWELGPDLRFTYLSDQFRDRAGFDPAQLLGRTRQELGACSDDASYRRHLDDLEARRPFRDFVYSSASLNGRWFRISGKPIFDDAGNFMGYRGVGADVSADVEARRRAEEFQTRFREAIEALNNGFALWGADDRLIVFNAGYGRAFPDIADLIEPGRSFEELTRAAASRGMYAVAPQDLDAFVAERLRRHRAPAGTMEQNLADGRWIQIKERHAAGGGIISAWTDITEIKQREQALRDSEERFALAVRGMNDGIWDWDLTSRRVFRSERLREMLGHDRSEPIGNKPWWLAQVHPGDVEAYKDALRGHLRSDRELFTREYRVRHASGGYRWVLDRAVSTRAANGRVARMVGSVTDITERKQMEMQLREANNAIREKNRQLGIALDNMSQGLTVFDAQDQLVVANSRYQEMYGLVPELLAPGTTVSELVAYSVGRGLFADDVASEAVEARHEAIRRGERRRVQQRHRDGRIIEIIHQPLADGGVVSTFSDVTEQESREHALRKARETAEAASRAKSAFLANMSHELRTPLNAIIGFSELINTEMLGPIGSIRYKEYAGDIHSSGKHLLQLINDVLDISKIEAGKAALREERVDVARVIEDCASIIRPQASASSLSVTLDIAPDLPDLRGDARAIKQILLNLLSNAVKFTPTGGSVELAAQLSATGDLELVVSDTGIGITDEDSARIFEPFFQVDSELSRRFEGTGLGLSLVKGLIAMHGGTIAVRSTPGQGSTFVVTLPASRTMPAASFADRPAAARRLGHAS